MSRRRQHVARASAGLALILVASAPLAALAQAPAPAGQGAPAANGASVPVRPDQLLRAAGFDPRQEAGSVWSTVYSAPGASPVKVYVSSSASLVLVQATVAAMPGLSSAVMTRILSLNFEVDFAKAAVNDDGELVVLHEMEARRADAAAVRTAVQAVGAYVNRLVGIVGAPSGEETDASLVRQRNQRNAFELQQGHVVLFYDAEAWKPMLIENPMRRAVLPGSTSAWQHAADALWISTGGTRVATPLEALPEQAFARARTQDPMSRLVRRGSRIVNGRRMLVQEWQTTVDGVPMLYMGHFFSDAAGTFEVIAWTTGQATPERRALIDGFVAGVQVRQ